MLLTSSAISFDPTPIRNSTETPAEDDERDDARHMDPTY